MTEEKLFPVMREMWDEIERLHEHARQMQPDFGMIAVGSEGAYEPAVADALSELLSELRRGKTIDESFAVASGSLREMVAKIGTRRPKDLNWGRWSEHGQDKLQHWAGRLREVLA